MDGYPRKNKIVEKKLRKKGGKNTMVNESYFVTHKGTKYPKRKKKRRRPGDPKGKSDSRYRDSYGL